MTRRLGGHIIGVIANRSSCGPFVLAACACLAHGCAPRPTEWEMFRHDWRLAEDIQGNASERAVADAQAKVLSALAELRTALGESSASASASRSDLAETVLRRAIDPGAPFPASFANPRKLEEDMSRLLRQAAEAPVWRLMEFRGAIEGRSDPDGMDPVRRAILDHEIRVRQTGRAG